MTLKRTMKIELVVAAGIALLGAGLWFGRVYLGFGRTTALYLVAIAAVAALYFAGEALADLLKIHRGRAE